MKKTVQFIILSILFGGFLASCSANKGFVSSVTRDDIHQMVQFELFDIFGRVVNGVSIIEDDSVTAIAKSLFEAELANSKISPVTKTIVVSDTIVLNKIQDEIRWWSYFTWSPFQAGSVKDIPISPTIDSILCSCDERFGLLIYNGGYTCPEGIYHPIGTGVISNRTEGYIRSAIIIVDSKLKNLAYIAHAESNSDPLKAETHRKQLEKLLKKYK